MNIPPVIVNTKEAKESLIRMIRDLPLDGNVVVTVEKVKQTRTDQQRKAIRLYCAWLSKAINDAGYDVKTFFKPAFKIPFTPDFVHENIWRILQIAITGKKSTKDLDRAEVGEIFDVTNVNMIEKGIYVAFPDKDLLRADQENAKSSN